MKTKEEILKQYVRKAKDVNGEFAVVVVLDAQKAMEEYKQQQPSREKTYEIDFNGHVKGKIKIKDNAITEVRAMNGWGDGIGVDAIIISELSEGEEEDRVMSICDNFMPDDKSTSATICKNCGKEKYLHEQPQTEQDKKDVLRIVDSCFHAYASSYRNDAEAMASELYDKINLKTTSSEQKPSRKKITEVLDKYLIKNASGTKFILVKDISDEIMSNSE